MIKRNVEQALRGLTKGYPVIAITGPRQSGKTTLARTFFPDKPYISLEDPDQLEFASTDPRRFLALYDNGAVFDEVQRCPPLFSYLQTKVDLDGRPGLYILTGSQHFGLLSGISQSLAGRVGFVQLLPFSLGELRGAGLEPGSLDELLFKGCYPPLYDRQLEPSRWHANYARTYIERDVRQVVNIRDLATFQRFVRMCAARTGQLLNLSSLANDCGITHNTARSWISVLEASYIVFLLQPHHNNFNKRLVKTPKLYFYDTGLASWLLGIHDMDQVAIHPMRGALFETWTISELLKGRFNQGKESNLYFWRDSSGCEIDVLREEGILLFPVEIKSGQTLTPDFLAGIEKWQKIAGDVSGRASLIYGGDQPQSRASAEVIPWRGLPEVASQ